ncbi:hypothetical protein ACP8HZ_06515 [Francisella noatunensis]
MQAAGLVNDHLVNCWCILEIYKKYIYKIKSS